ncbi:MAG: cation-transporting P-type ATPase [Woeseiaceae bacterium]|nr:cation-transporting P-type ATPase [Woeseiaceae bacterium]
MPDGDIATRWHAQSTDEAVSALSASADGLTEKEAARRLASLGPNLLPQGPKRGAWQRLLMQFHNVLIYVLLAAAALSIFLDHPIDAGVILAVVIVNAAIGYIQEGRAEDALEAIRSMIDPQATVVRDGQRTTVAAAEVVPGDVVLVESGDRVPADLRLLRAKNLRIDEAILTGESMAVTKSVDAVPYDAPLGDRTSLAFSGTFVAAGQGAGLVVDTGAKTELGRISEMIGEVETLKTPLLRQMDAFGKRLSAFIVAIASAAFVFSVWFRDYAWADAFMAVVGLAVAAIPEGLPATMTITLAIGVQRMAARHAIIRRLPAVETLGSVSVICSDKTGTLTRNEMTVRSVTTSQRLFDVSGVGYHPEGDFLYRGEPVAIDQLPRLQALTLAAILCSDATVRLKDGEWRVDGDPMEAALLVAGMKSGLDPVFVRKSWPRDDEIPFESEHRFMATLHHDHEGRGAVYIKGAPERLLEMCSRQRGLEGDEDLDRDYWQRRILETAARGERVLALAEKPIDPNAVSLTFSDVEAGLTLLGFFGFADPPREEAIRAVAECRQAGIRVKMVTGDHAATATEIARQLGLADDPITRTGQDIAALDDDQLRAAALETSVFARTTPENKLRLVEALQADGLTVAMTGDGVNDAPALKRADVGIAMGRKGTEAAKEAAEMVLADDNFASIVAAVREGRTVYDNLMKVVSWTLPTNGGEALTILAALAFGLALPITPVQILWINMITAATLGLTLAFEPTERGAMQRAPRIAGQAILGGRLLWRIGFVSVLFLIGAFGMYYWAEARGLPVEVARTIVVNTIVVMEIFYLFSVRYVHGTSLTREGALGTRPVLIGVGLVTAAQFAMTYAPFMQVIFDTRPVAFLDGIFVVAAGVAMLFVVEIEKAVWRRLSEESPSD